MHSVQLSKPSLRHDSRKGRWIGCCNAYSWLSRSPVCRRPKPPASIPRCSHLTPRRLLRFPPFLPPLMSCSPHPPFTPTPRLLPLLPLAIQDDPAATGMSLPTLFLLLSLRFPRCKLASLGPVLDLEVPIGRSQCGLDGFAGVSSDSMGVGWIWSSFELGLL